MPQNLGQVKTPLTTLTVSFAGARPLTGNEQPFQFLFAADYAGGFALADGHPCGHCEDVLKQPVLDCLPLHHAVLLTMTVP